MEERHVRSSYLALRVAYGVVPVVAGVDKFTNLLTHWQAYLSPLALRMLPVSPTVFMRAAGIVEIVVGIGILLGYGRIFGWVAMAWLAAIALNIIASGHALDVAARDAVMAVGAFALARLAQVQEVVAAREQRVAPTRAASAHA